MPWGEGIVRMATDRDEQVHEQQRQQRELEEIRRSFAEMGARMGSLFEPAEPDEPEPAPPAERKALPAPPPAPPLLAGRPRWWWTAALTLLFLVGGLFGYLLPRGDGGSAPTPTTAAVQGPVPTAPPETVIVTKISVPESCLDTAGLGDEVIARLNRNQRDNRLFLALRDYTIASQACRKEASP
jgi:anti-sigma factor RsiW